MDRNHRRRFGQNFLDDAMALAIASDLPVKSGQPILEIGPGHGALTRHLLQRTEALTAVEIDPECAELVARTFAGRPITVINQDFMKFDLDSWCEAHPESWAAGNLPYNVATGILVRLVERIEKFSGVMAMVQYEVALRLCAQPCSSDYGSLSVFVAAHCDRKLLRKIGPEHFTPKPNVDSATVLLTPRKPIMATPPGFFEFVQACFAHKRKRLSNSLTGPWTKTQIMDAISGLGLGEHTRAEELSPEVFLDLYRSLHVSTPT